jgi:Pro-Pro endopeptidase
MKKIIAYAGLSLLLVGCSNVSQLPSSATFLSQPTQIQDSFNIYFETYFDMEIETVVFNNKNKYKINLPILTYPTYKFEGWFFDKDFKYEFDYNNLKGDTKLFSKWSLPRIENKDILEVLVILPTTDYDNLEATKMIYRLETLGEDILRDTYNYGTRLHLMNTNLTGHPDWSFLKGFINPDGFPMDLSVGAGNPQTKQAYVKIGNSNMGQGHGALNLELHEIAHFVNDVYNQPSKTNLFTNIWKTEKDIVREMLMVNGHFDREEYFCEMFSYYFYNFETRRAIYKHAPETYNFMKERFSWGGN